MINGKLMSWAVHRQLLGGQGIHGSPLAEAETPMAGPAAKKRHLQLTAEAANLPGHPMPPNNDWAAAWDLIFPSIIVVWEGSRRFDDTEAAETIVMVVIFHLFSYFGCCCSP